MWAIIIIARKPSWRDDEGGDTRANQSEREVCLGRASKVRVIKTWHFLITNNKQLKLNDIVNNDTGRLPITLFM